MEKEIEKVNNLFLEEAEEALRNPFVFKKSIKNVAVIGAGVSGLSSARHMRDLGISVRVFERNPSVGGVWLYNEERPIKPEIPTPSMVFPDQSNNVGENHSSKDKPEVKEFMLGKYPPSPCYRDMCNNIPSKYLAYPDFPFPEGTKPYNHHSVMLKYLTEYANKFQLNPLITFNTSVEQITKNPKTNLWEVQLSQYNVANGKSVKVTTWRESFDAVVIASGAYQVPYIPTYENIKAWDKKWPSMISHSKQFRCPEHFLNKNVLVVGGSISAIDITRSLEGIAKTVYMSIRGPMESPVAVLNVLRKAIPSSTVMKPGIKSFSEVNTSNDHSILFEDNSTLDDVDEIIFCTGYVASYGFLNGLLTTPKKNEQEESNDIASEKRVVTDGKFPLNVYKETFFISDPTLAFVGIQRPFSTPVHLDGQSHAVARVWSGHAKLPTCEYMIKSLQQQPEWLSFTTYAADRLRRDQHAFWLNYHEKKESKDSLPDVMSYEKNYEKEAESYWDLWFKDTDRNFEMCRKQINELKMPS
ncbi:hypothetical protein BDB01DRAFT_775022 [Pilobolus umbonatus]|nr:hypothetical protein BDB01DRAFT_775022 [Pilobolus umbonatus]